MSYITEMEELREIKDPEEFKKAATSWLLRGSDYDKPVLLSREDLQEMVEHSISIGMARQDYYHDLKGAVNADTR